jgi:hypothetical protein
MKRHLLFVMLALLVSTTAMAQVGSICVYWDEAGTIQDASLIENGNAPQTTYTGYVIIFVEDVVAGASYGLSVDSVDAALASQTFPAGLQIGDALAGGVEVGLTTPLYGFLNTPVIISELLIINTNYPNPAHLEISVLPHPAYGAPVYADGAEIIKTLEICQGAVANENETFSNMKSLYR